MACFLKKNEILIENVHFEFEYDRILIEKWN